MRSPERRRCLAAAWLLATGAHAQASTEARVKARLALNLARFTQWSSSSFASPSEPLLMCLLQQGDVLTGAFGELVGQSVAGHPVRVAVNPLHAETLLPGCHVVFVHASASALSPTVIAALGTAPVLTIGDAEGFAARGGMVELVNVNDNVRLDVNLRALRLAGLGLSSQVLKLARQVRE